MCSEGLRAWKIRDRSKLDSFIWRGQLLLSELLGLSGTDTKRQTVEAPVFMTERVS